MRFFPRAARRRAAVASLASALTIGALAVPIANAVDGDHLEHRQKQAQGQVHAAGRDLEDASSRLRRTSAALEQAQSELRRAKRKLDGVRTELADARVRDREMQDELDAAVVRLGRAQDELIAGQGDLADQRQNVVDTVTSIYEQGPPQLLAFTSLVKAETPADLTRRIAFTDAVVGREDNSYDDLSAAEVLLKVRETSVSTARDDVAVRRQAAADHLTTVETLHQRTLDAKQSVRDLVDSSRDTRQAANAARKHDRRVLDRAKRQEDRIHDQIVAAARRAKARNARGGYHGDADGLLLPPVDGVVTSPFGYRIHPIFGYYGLHDGTDFGVSCGQGLRASASGTVVKEYYSSVFGNRLYLNLGQINGKNITVVYNHASGYRVGAGARVGRGDVVGYVGDTGWSTGCHLHFTVLENGAAVDPMGYL